jgi:hypothetical protein
MIGRGVVTITQASRSTIDEAPDIDDGAGEAQPTVDDQS